MGIVIGAVASHDGAAGWPTTCDMSLLMGRV